MDLALIGNIMNLKNNIKKIIKEETSLQKRVRTMLKSTGLLNTINVVGGINNIIKILDLDIDDIRVQEDLVKSYLEHNDLDVEVYFLNVSRVSRYNTTIVSHIEDGTAANQDSWFVRMACDRLNEILPFKVEPSWGPMSKKSSETKIFLDAIVEYDDEDDF